MLWKRRKKERTRQWKTTPNVKLRERTTLVLKSFTKDQEKRSMGIRKVAGLTWNRLCLRMRNKLIYLPSLYAVSALIKWGSLFLADFTSIPFTPNNTLAAIAVIGPPAFYALWFLSLGSTKEWWPRKLRRLFCLLVDWNEFLRTHVKSELKYPFEFVIKFVNVPDDAHSHRSAAPLPDLSSGRPQV